MVSWIGIMIITIDGPAASGKGTVARRLATLLGFDYLDTGAMYRAVALAIHRAQIPWDDSSRIEATLPQIQIHIAPGQVLLNNQDVTQAIRSSCVSQGASKVATIPAVRQFLIQKQRQIAFGRNIVCEGRDQGSVVFPNACLKFFITADVKVRAARRYRELSARGDNVSLQQVLDELIERDRRDSQPGGGLRQPPDAIVVDTTFLNPNEVVNRLEREIQKRTRPNWTGRLFYDFVYWSSYTFFRFGFSYRRTGWHLVPKLGPVLLVANHQSMFDPVLIGLASRRYLSFLARKNLFEQPFLAPIIRKLNAIPIDRSMGKEGIQSVLDALEQGQAVLVFPEGERTHTGEVQPLKPGVTLLIKRVNCPIVPVGIAGAFAAWNRHMDWPQPSPLFLPPESSTIAVSVGEPVDSAQFKNLDRDSILRDLQMLLIHQVSKAEHLRRK
jgi:cytidylate kinase